MGSNKSVKGDRMKVGDLVQQCFYGMVGVTIREVYAPLCATTINKVFDILWQDGTIGHNIWNYDLELFDEKGRYGRDTQSQIESQVRV